MTWSINVTLDVGTAHCATCGTLVFMSSDYMGNRKQDHSLWHCPNGHANTWMQQTEEEKLQQRVKQLQAEVHEARAAALRAERARKTAERKAAKTAEAAAGVVPIKRSRKPA